MAEGRESPTTALYAPTGEVLTEVVVPPFPMDPAATVCPCGGIGTSHAATPPAREAP